MERSEIEARLDFLHGLVIGLQAAVRGLIATHPEPDRAIEHVQSCIEDMAASGLASAATSDDLLQGIHRSAGSLLPTQAQLDRAEVHQTPPPDQAHG